MKLTKASGVNDILGKTIDKDNQMKAAMRMRLVNAEMRVWPFKMMGLLRQLAPVVSLSFNVCRSGLRLEYRYSIIMPPEIYVDAYMDTAHAYINT